MQIAVLDRDRTTPPASPAEGDRHIVAGGATGAWAGQADAVAVFEDGAWHFLAPKLGWCAWCDADGALLVYDGAAWTDAASGGGGSGNLALLGINDTASDPNLLTVKSNEALLNANDLADGGTGDMRLQISKESKRRNGVGGVLRCVFRPRRIRPDRIRRVQAQGLDMTDRPWSRR